MASGHSGRTLKLVSWNIDGLDERDLEERTIAVVQTILLKQPDFVFLQEVVRASKDTLERKLKVQYACYFSPQTVVHYFNAILVKRASAATVAGPLTTVPFPNSTMGRELLQLPLTFPDFSLLLLTTHLESLRDYSSERKAQLRQAFEIMTTREKKMMQSEEGSSREKKEPSVGKVCLFGGDLNVREAEVRSVKLPPDVADVWEYCGESMETKFTWDVQENDNLNWAYPNKPRARYDRLYLWPQSGRVRPRSFDLIGLDRLHSCSRFPATTGECGRSLMCSNRKTFAAHFVNNLVNGLVAY